MNKTIVWVMLKNSICVICWTALAIIFNKWWVALFGVLFLTSYETRSNYFRICDKCGKRSPSASDYNEALDKAMAAGWLHITESNSDFCPCCRHK